MENKDVHLTAEKNFPASVDDLADAWVNPDKLKQWWKPAGNHLKDVDIDLKVGGKFRYAFETGDGVESLKITGDYKEVEPKKKLVYSWNWELPSAQEVAANEFELTIEFMPAESGSSIHVTQKNFKDEESIHPHQEGWDKALDDLSEFLAK